MITEILSKLQGVVAMSLAQKKERLIEIKLKQLILERTTGSLLELSSSDELEAMSILSLMFDPSSADKSIEETLNEITALKTEIETEAEKRFEIISQTVKETL